MIIAIPSYGILVSGRGYRQGGAGGGSLRVRRQKNGCIPGKEGNVPLNNSLLPDGVLFTWHRFRLPPARLKEDEMRHLHKSMRSSRYNRRVMAGACVIAAALLFVVPILCHGADLEDIQKRGTLLHIGVPYANFVTGSGDGLDVELMERFARYLGIGYQYVPSTWADAIPDLVGKRLSQGFETATPVKGDIIANGMTILPQREKMMAFGTPTFPTQVWLISRNDSSLSPISPSGDSERDISSVKALLNGRDVLGIVNTCTDPDLYQLKEAGARSIWFPGGLNELAPAIINGEAELTLLDVPDSIVALEKWPGKLKVIGPISGVQFMSCAFPKESEKLRESFNVFFEQIKRDGSYLQLVRKYYPTAVDHFPEFSETFNRADSLKMNVDKDLLRKQNFSTILFSFALIGCITFLLLVTYISQKRIQDFALDQLRQDAEKRAEAVSYFYLERRNDLKSLAEHRALSTFFENRALGMSMQYGLGDSLFAMAEQFGKLLDEKQLGKRNIFSRIIFMTNDGMVLAERGPKKSDGSDETAHLIRPEEGTDPEIRLTGEGREPEVIVTIPYYFKEKLTGKIIAYIATDLVHDYLLQAHASSSRRTLTVTSGNGSVLYTVSGPAQTYAHGIKQRFPEMAPGETYRYILHGDDGKGEEVIALRVHIRETPCYLISVAPAEEILSWLSPAQLLFFMATVCFLILTGMLLVTRMNTRKFVLQTRLDEVAKSERVLEERNTLLQKEINDRHQAEDSLRNSEERFSTFMSHLPAAVSIKDPEGRILFANQYSRHLYGREDCIGKTLFELFPVELAERKAADDRRALSQGLQVVTETIRDGLGNERLLETHKFPVPTGHDQTLLGTVSLDITERKRAEEEKERLESRLRQTQKIEAIGTLAGGIAHDFNNILVPIVGYTEMVLNDDYLIQPLREKLEQVLSAAYRARDLVKQLLALGRRGDEQHRIPVEISSIVKEVLKLLRATLPSTIEIMQEIESGVAMADGTQIHQVLMNLCTNASHAMNEEGLLEVSLRRIDLNEKDLDSLLPDHLRPGPYLQLSVSDNGCGMGSGTIARIFDPYFTTKDIGKGSGLGLAVVHGIVARHEGGITVRSEPGRGTQFCVYLPRLETIASLSTNTVTALPTGNEHILLIDDEQSVVKMETESLEQLGYKVTPQTDSLHALEVFRSSPGEFDVIITDYTMPKLTGIDLTDAVRRIRPNIPVILCTGFSEKVTKEVVAIRSLELLMKPFNIKQLAELVRKVLDPKENHFII